MALDMMRGSLFITSFRGFTECVVDAGARCDAPTVAPNIYVMKQMIMHFVGAQILRPHLLPTKG